MGLLKHHSSLSPADGAGQRHILLSLLALAAPAERPATVHLARAGVAATSPPTPLGYPPYPDLLHATREFCVQKALQDVAKAAARAEASPARQQPRLEASDGTEISLKYCGC